MSTMTPNTNGAKDCYLDLVKRALLGSVYPELDCIVWPHSMPLRKLLRAIFPSDVRLFKMAKPGERGLHWPSHAYSMVGPDRMDNLRFCVEDVIAKGVPGDVIETGVWRGGSCIFMRAILKANGITDRTVWAADSFEGLPKPDAEKYPDDAGDKHSWIPELAVSVEQVKKNFEAFGLLDNQVKFLKGWFKDTLPTAPIGKLAVARLDGDMYESTMDALVSLYPKLSVGGYLIVDDYGAVEACKKAIHDFRDKHGIKDPIRQIDIAGVFWQKSA